MNEKIPPELAALQRYTAQQIASAYERREIMHLVPFLDAGDVARTWPKPASGEATLGSSAQLNRYDEVGLGADPSNMMQQTDGNWVCYAEAAKRIAALERENAGLRNDPDYLAAYLLGFENGKDHVRALLAGEGNPLSGSNLYLRPDRKTGNRVCRICQKIRAAK